MLSTGAPVAQSAAGMAVFLLSLLRYWPEMSTASASPVGPETWNLAHNLREYGEFANPFMSMGTGPSAHLAPAFPAFLAALTWLFGTHAGGAFAFHAAAALAVSVLLGALPWAAAKLGYGLIPGILAAAAWLAGDLFLFPNWEAVYAGLLILSATVSFRGLAGAEPPRPGQALTLAAVASALLLLNPACLSVFACWFVWIAYKWKRALFRFPAILIVALPVAISAVWIARNYAVFDRFVLIRDNLGIELAIGNNDCASFSLVANHLTGCFQRNHPNASEIEAVKVLLDGEVVYNDRRMHEARAWIGRNPGRFAGLSLERAAAFWVPRESAGFLSGVLERGRRSERLMIFAMTLLSLAGLWFAARRDAASTAIMASWLAVYPLPYYLVQFEDRYRYPIMWITFLLGALALCETARRLWPLVRGLLAPGGR